MNEAKLIAWLRKNEIPKKDVILGIGDDAALVRSDSGRILLKAELVVEGVHFDRRSREGDWGRKALASALSDIAAMGGDPQYALVSIGVPRDFTLARTKKIMKGILELARRYGVSVVGGDTSRSERMVIAVALIGKADPKKIFRRSGAKAGDAVFVTGRLGGSLESSRHLTFEPRLGESRFLRDFYPVHAMIDVSDGLTTDLGHLALESRVGMVLFEKSIPLHRGASIESAFTEGEDFELVFTLSESEARKLLRDRRRAVLGYIFYLIGGVVDEKRGLLIEDACGKKRKFPKARDHHFGDR